MNKIAVNEEIIIYAFRYALTRRSYAVASMVTLLYDEWNALGLGTKILIKNEIKEAIKENIIQDEIDRKMWINILQLPTEVKPNV